MPQLFKGIPLISPFSLLHFPICVTSPDSLYVLCSVQSPPVQCSFFSFCLRLSNGARRSCAFAPWIDIGATLQVDLTGFLGATREGRMHGAYLAICNSRSITRSD